MSVSCYGNRSHSWYKQFIPTCISFICLLFSADFTLLVISLEPYDLYCVGVPAKTKSRVEHMHFKVFFYSFKGHLRALIIWKLNLLKGAVEKYLFETLTMVKWTYSWTCVRNSVVNWRPTCSFVPEVKCSSCVNFLEIFPVHFCLVRHIWLVLLPWL